MGIGKQIALVPLTGCSVADLQAALTQLVDAARLAAWGQFAWHASHSSSSTVYVADEDGVHPCAVELIEETLSDGSKAYNVVLRFPTEVA